MPRRRQPPRLYLRDDEQVWVIRDGSKTIRTGCGVADSQGAEAALATYLARKFTPIRHQSDPARILISEALAAYGREHVPHGRPASIESAGYNIAALLPYWGDKTLADIRGSSCREYAQGRYQSGVGPGTARRELALLSAAVNFWHRERGPLDGIPVVTLPTKPPARAHWLSRGDAALLLAGMLGLVSVDRSGSGDAARACHLEKR